MKNLIYIMAVICFTLISQPTTKAQQLSEQELKVNVQGIRNCTEQLKQLTPITFNYDTQKFSKLDLPKGNQYGFLANNVKSVLPNIIKESSQVYAVGKNTTRVAKYEEVDQGSLIPLLVAAIKEQQEQIESLQKEVEELKAKREE